ncbi:MAG TPA: hypothetical protein VKT29_10485 [Terriglobales bacterium]|nr:hypothetical protein [Terriglobales bacterium]
MGTLSAWGQEACLTASDMGAGAVTTLQSTAKRYFQMAAQGDSAALQQNAIPSLAANFAGVEGAINDHKADFAGAQTSVRPPYVLEAPGSAPQQRAEFFCGIYNSPDRVGFSIPGLPPGTYAVVIQDVTTPKAARYSVTMVLEEQAADGAAPAQAENPEAALASATWKLAGYYVRPETVNGHDGQWFWDKARQYKSQGQMLNAYYYYVEARQLLSPVDFMGTPQLDKIYDETQQAVPKDMPVNGPVDNVIGGQTYKLAQVFPVPVGEQLDLVLKYQVPDISDTTKTFQQNMTLIKAFVAKYPEVRSAFDAIVARAVNPSGQDYGSLLPMKEIK